MSYPSEDYRSFKTVRARDHGYGQPDIDRRSYPQDRRRLNPVGILSNADRREIERRLSKSRPPTLEEMR